MADREKVIKGLECCQSKDCVNCPYKEEQDETYSGLCQHIMEYEKGDYVIVQNTSKIEEVKITVVNRETEDYEFFVDGQMLIKAIRKCIELT